MRDRCGRKNKIKPRKGPPGRRLRRLLVTLAVCGAATLWSAALPALDVAAPSVVLTGVPASFTVTGVRPGSLVSLRAGVQGWHVEADVDGTVEFADVIIHEAGNVDVSVVADSVHKQLMVRVIHGWISVMPALLAIAVALLFP